MDKTRIEAFSDGVLAIIITIMVLELKPPAHAPELDSLRPLLPAVLSYLLSFIYLAIYWNNHHHLLLTVQRVSPGIMWANMHLLFWLSLIPFATAWMGENDFAPAPTAMYGCILLCSAMAYFILQASILRSPSVHEKLQRALGRDVKGKLSLVAYAIAIPTAFISQEAAGALYVAVALAWLIPDRRISDALRAT
ncbi:MAG: DUF1211 domain-containing protein [Bdellovibrionales bacterium]|nr:DUF1211 domain-containing protein [Bdellovibrionales bacterium]